MAHPSGPAFLHQVQAKVEIRLTQALDTRQQHPTLAKAMAHACLGGGKRIRAALVMATAQTLGVTEPVSVPYLITLAAALETMHAYSLVHDDLPSMDDDNLRRGKPTCHIMFDEATAILAGDALQTLAFELIYEAYTESLDGAPAHSHSAPDTQSFLYMVQTLSHAAGAKGMVAGQMMDMEAEGKHITLSQLEQLHRYKTGALISASIQLGYLAVTTTSPKQKSALDGFGHTLGLAFQVQDDILDIEGSTKTLGKAQGADIAKQKSTYPSLLGMSATKQKAQDLLQQGLSSLALFNQDNVANLHYLAHFIVMRDA